MFLWSMRQYRDNLIKNGYTVFYHSIDEESFHDKYEDKLLKVIKNNNIEKLKYFEIEDKDFEDKIIKFINQKDIDIIENKALNERFYGDLQGLNKDECRQKWGAEQVQIWRRSYDVGPPGGESLKETGDRVLPYYLSEIYPLILDGKNVLVAAHGNSLRSLIKHLDKLSADEIVKLEIPTGAPIQYIFNDQGDVLTKKNLIE